MLKSFLMKQMIKRQMKGVPEDQQEQIIAMVEKHPDFFMKIAHDIEERVKGGMTQQNAMLAVMKANEAELRMIAGK